MSVQKYGLQAFSIIDGRIRKNLASGVGGFEEYGYGYSGPHVISNSWATAISRR